MKLGFAVGLSAFAICHCGALAQIVWRVRSSGTTSSISDVVYGRGIFLAIDPLPLTSPDGIVWTRQTWTGGKPISKVFFGGKVLLGLGSSSFWLTGTGLGENPSEYSYGGRTLSGAAGAAFLEDRWVIIGPRKTGEASTPFVMTGNTLSPATLYPTAESPSWIVATDSEFLLGTSSAIFASPDGYAWTLRIRRGFTSAWWHGGILLGKTWGSGSETSNDSGKTWTAEGGNPQAFGEKTYVNVADPNSGLILVSQDLKKWDIVESGTTDKLNDVAFGAGVFVAVGNAGRIVTGASQDPTPVEVPEIKISKSVIIKWSSKLGFLYQPQFSYDNRAWLNFGGAIDGTGKEMSRNFEIAPDRYFFRILVK